MAASRASPGLVNATYYYLLGIMYLFLTGTIKPNKTDRFGITLKYWFHHDSRREF